MRLESKMRLSNIFKSCHRERPETMEMGRGDEVSVWESQGWLRRNEMDLSFERI